MFIQKYIFYEFYMYMFSFATNIDNIDRMFIVNLKVNIIKLFIFFGS